MAKYDGYQPRLESLVTELQTEWPAEMQGFEPSARRTIAAALHADASAAASVRYDRQHTGFARVIVVTGDDCQRLGYAVPSPPA